MPSLRKATPRSQYQEDNISFDADRPSWSKDVVTGALDKVYTKLVRQEFPVTKLAARAGKPVADYVENQVRRMRGLGGIVEQMLMGKGPSQGPAMPQTSDKHSVPRRGPLFSLG